MKKQGDTISEKETVCLQKQRSFSALGELQREHTVIYELQEKDGDWVLSVSQREADARRTESVTLPGDSRQAFQLRDYLYENAVPIESWQDVLADILPGRAYFSV